MHDKDLDDPTKNYNRGVDLYREKKFLCAIYSLDRAISMSPPGANGRTSALFARAGAYDGLSGETYEFSIQAVRDYHRVGQLDSTKAAIAYYRSGRLMFGVADKFTKRNAEKIGIYESAIPDFEKAINLSDATTQRDINYDLFNTRIRIVRTLIAEIQTQKRKAANEQVTKLTEKLNTFAAKIEADYKVLSRDPAVAAELLKPYTAFTVMYDEFKKAQ